MEGECEKNGPSGRKRPICPHGAPSKSRGRSFSLKESFLRQVLLKLGVRLSITTSLVKADVFLNMTIQNSFHWSTSLDKLLHLDDGGQGELWEADGTGLRVEVFQYQVIQLVNQSILKCKKQ